MNLFPVLDQVRNQINRRRWSPDRVLAARGEDLAMRYLQKQKFTIIERNYRPRKGKQEVDLIAWEGDSLAFIEVKTRSSDETGAPERAVTPEKQKHLIHAAERFTRYTKVDLQKVRFDIIAILDGNPPKIELFRDAFRVTAERAWRNSPYGPAPSGSYPQL